MHQDAIPGTCTHLLDPQFDLRLRIEKGAHIPCLIHVSQLEDCRSARNQVATDNLDTDARQVKAVLATVDCQQRVQWKSPGLRGANPRPVSYTHLTLPTIYS